MIRYLLSLLLIVLVGCQGVNNNKKQIYVSIEPLRWVVGSMVDTSEVSVEVLVGGATSPETFEPTARQVASLQNSELYFGLNLFDFEKVLYSKIENSGVTMVDLCKEMKILDGCCSSSEHSHNGDPHIWLSPLYMRGLIINSADALRREGLLVEGKSDSLLMIVDEAHNFVLSASKNSDVTAFAIIHPSLTYFAQDYGLEQIALEVDGKEPSARSLTQSFEKMSKHNVTALLYSSQDSQNITRIVQDNSNFELVAFEPLTANWLETICKLTSIIYGTN